MCLKKTGREQLLSCVCESTQRPKVGNGKNTFFIAEIGLHVKFATETAKQTQKI